MRAAVFVHGAGGGAWEWNVWARVFAAAGFAVHAPDLQPSPAGLAATTLEEYAAQVDGAVRSVRATAVAQGGEADAHVVLVGASLGGLLAAMNAGYANALVLVNPVPPGGLPGEPPTAPLRCWGLHASLEGTRRALPDADDFTTLYAFRRWRDESGRVLAQAHAGRAVPAPACPVLVIASEADADVPPAVSRALAEAWNARLAVVPGSHVAPLLGRHAAAAAALAVDWLNTPGTPA